MDQSQAVFLSSDLSGPQHLGHTHTNVIIVYNTGTQAKNTQHIHTQACQTNLINALP